MEKKSQDFSIKEAQRLSATPEGQRLMQLLHQQDAAQLQKVMDAAGSGKYQEARKMLSSFFAAPEVQQLIRQLGGNNGRF